METIELVYCSTCQKDLPRNMFYIRYERVIYPCKSCKKEYYIKWKQINKEYHKTWQTENKDRCRAYNVKHRANKKKKPSA